MATSSATAPGTIPAAGSRQAGILLFFAALVAFATFDAG